MSKTMTLLLPDREMQVLEEIASRQDTSKTAVLRQALRLYQLVLKRRDDGEEMSFTGDRGRRNMLLVE